MMLKDVCTHLDRQTLKIQEYSRGRRGKPDVWTLRMKGVNTPPKFWENKGKSTIVFGLPLFSRFKLSVKNADEKVWTLITELFLGKNPEIFLREKLTNFGLK